MTDRDSYESSGWDYDIEEVILDELEAQQSGCTTDFGGYDTAIVVLGRINSEGRDYIPGTAGVSDEGAKDPLGLSDDEREMIEMAKSNADKVVVLINSNSAMEIPEVANDEDIDAILWIGTPGSYGMPAVAEILVGDVNPSGHLPDTYAYDNSVSPAAQNWDIFTYDNLDEIGTEYGDEDVTNGVALDAATMRASAYTVYAEGIYVGYKYYETRYANCVMDGTGTGASGSVGAADGQSSWSYDTEVLYPFGYGLSYTDFTQTIKSVEVDKDEETMTAVVEVENNTSTAGKEAVQLYVSVPYTDYDKENLVEKAAIQLLDYEKVELDGNESTEVTLVADLQNMASYDSNGAGTYILDDGNYYFSVGNGAHEALNNVLAAQGYGTEDGMTDDGDATNVQVWNNSGLDSTSCAYSDNGEEIENQLDNADLNYYIDGAVTYLSRQDYTNTFPEKFEDLEANDEMIAQLRNRTYEVQTDEEVTDQFGVDYGDEQLSLAAMKGAEFDDERWHRFLNQIPLEDAVQIIAQGGSATWTIEAIQNPYAKQSDGPNGFNSNGIGSAKTNTEDPYYTDSTDANYGFILGTLPNAPVIAASFDKDIAYRAGVMIGDESLWVGSPIIWAGGANQHRAPYEGRTHEYFSEDAVLSQLTLEQQCWGGREKGCIIGPKHFAFNAIEFNRYGLSEYMTEQCAREGELRCFQAAFESGAAIGTMTAFNRIGCSYINGHEGLMQNILRGEWGYQGIASTDMVNNQYLFVLAETILGGITMMSNGSGVNDPDSSYTASGAYWEYSSAENIANDATLCSRLRENMHYQWWAYAQSNVLNGWNESTSTIELMTWWRVVIIAGISASAVLAAGSVVMYVLVFAKGKDPYAKES